MKPEWVSEHQWAPLNGRSRNILISNSDKYVLVPK